MDLILCHGTADFDSLGAAVGLTKLKKGAKLVLTGGAHPGVKDFLALHRDEFALIERRSVDTKKIRSLAVVDAQKRERLGTAASWFDLPQLDSIEIYDHHLEADADIPATHIEIEPVGAASTIIVEKLQQEDIQITPWEATVMALGIHVDTGSLTFAATTARDAKALAWLLEKSAIITSIAEYVEQGLSPQLQQLLTKGWEEMETSTVAGYTVAWLLLETDAFVPGLSSLSERLLKLSRSDALVVANQYHRDKANDYRLSLIGRSRIPETNLHQLFEPLGGGGHAQATSATLSGVDAKGILTQVIEGLIAQIPQPITAKDLMSSPVRTIRPQTTISEAQRILLRYGHSGLSVVNEEDKLVGVISRRDLDLALHHGFSHAPVKGYMSQNLKTITPKTSLPEIESLMVTYDIGRLPVLQGEQLIGIVTRTDVLRQRHQETRGNQGEELGENNLSPYCLTSNFQELITPHLWKFITQAAHEAQKQGWNLYLVGGAVRDMLLAKNDKPLLLQDIDMVVDGFDLKAEDKAGVKLAKALQKIYPQSRLDVHGAFQTAALLWHKDPEFGSLWVDIATARTEFYPYPAANPEVEASSICQDLYRRDFTINALALKLTPPRVGEMLDFFGGVYDLRSQQIRVLHANSFIEDPTRIYRAVRFAVRLGFEIEPQTEQYIRYALESGVYDRSQAENGKTPALQTRLKAELKYLLQASYWKSALELLASLGALKCLHPQLELEPKLWWEVRFLDRCLRIFDPQYTLIHWQMRLEVLIAYLPSSQRGRVATRLQMTADSITRLEELAQVQSRISEALPKCVKASEIYQLLHPYKLPTLVLLGAKVPRSLRRQIWHYLTKLSQVKAPLNGKDLTTLGYKPGKEYKQILGALLVAKLDGIISDRPEAEAFVKDNFRRQ